MFGKRGPGDQRNLRTRGRRNGTQNEATNQYKWDPQPSNMCQPREFSRIVSQKQQPMRRSQTTGRGRHLSERRRVKWSFGLEVYKIKNFSLFFSSSPWVAAISSPKFQPTIGGLQVPITWVLPGENQFRSVRCEIKPASFDSIPFLQGKGDFLLYGFCMLGAVLVDLNYVWMDWIVYVTVNKENMWLWGHIMIWLMI